MRFFDRFFGRRRSKPAGPAPSATTLAELKDFISSRDGVEAYIEPPTAVYAMTLCLVAADGEFLRRPVKDQRQARGLCADRGVPLYDARIVGYPKRMRDYERGIRQERIGLDDLPPLEITEEPGRDD
ncbi:MAG: oxidoreductase [Actinomycetota bacterium]|nr:oxidoreductase [Actinomycetota bacterium]